MKLPDTGTDQLWEKSYPPGVSWAMEPVCHPVHQAFEEQARARPDSPCLDFLDNKYTYGEVFDRIRCFACGLQKLGFGKGSKIGLCLPNCPYYVFAYYAVLKVGATVVNFNLLYTEAEIKQQIDNSEIDLMITLDLKLVFPKVYACLQSTVLKQIIVCSFTDVLPPLKRCLFRLFRFRELARIPRETTLLDFKQVSSHGVVVTDVVIDPLQDIALFQYTGGTTGRPKAAMLSHSNVTSNAVQVTLWLEADMGSLENEKFLAVIPFFHVFAMTAILNMGLGRGAEIIMLPRFDLKAVLRTITAKKPTIFPGIPAIFNAINHAPDLVRYDLSSIKYCISGGASLPVTVKQQFEAHTGCSLVEGYGLSETSPVVSCNPANDGGKAGSIGLPLPGTKVQIGSLDDIQEILETGATGELLVHGPQVMQGYWNAAEETAGTLLADGWLRTGDVGYMDEAGYLFLTDRLKDIIICNGYKIYPRVIEDALYQHPDVVEAIVIGIPSASKGEQPKAFVTLSAGAKASEAELLDFVCGKLNPIERPVAVEVRKELPHTLIGKLSKKELIAEEAEKRK